MDRGHERTEQVISKIEGRLKAEYEQAGKELQETIDDYMARFELKDKKWQEWVKDGKRTQDQYDKWRKQQLMQGERWKKLKEQIAFDMTNANANAREIVRSYMPEVYEINANYALYQIEVGNGYTLPSSLTLYNREAIARMVKDEPDLMPMGKQILGDIARGKAERWERQKVQSIMMQGILQGKSNVRIANDIANNLANGDFKASMRYARTMSTNAQNGGRYGAYRRLEENGVPLTLQWEATLDMRTRHEHRMMHGQRRNVNQPFSVDGVEILYPAWLGVGDYKVPPDMIWNCRCTILAWVKGFEHDALRQSERMEGLSYEDWLYAKEKTLPITHQRDVGEAMRMRYIREYGGDGSGIKKSFADRVRGIIDKAKQEGKGRTTETIRAAGKEFAKEVNGYLADKKKALDNAKAEYEKQTSRLDKLNDEEMLLRKLRDGKLDLATHGYKSDQEVLDRLDEVRKKSREIRLSQEYNDAMDAYFEARHGLHDPKRHRQYLRDKIGEVREVGLGQYGDKKSQKNVTDHLQRSRSPMRKVVESAYDHYPTEWVERSIDFGVLTPKKVNRGYYSHFWQEIAISGSGGESSMETAIHELGHRFERVVPDILKQEKEFYDSRTSGEQLQWLGAGYDQSEVTRRDKFVDAYMGKDYGGSAYELVSMGFEFAYTAPAELAKDPDMQEWILGMLLTL